MKILLRMILIDRIVDYFRNKRINSKLKYAIEEYVNARPLLQVQPASACSESFYRWDRLNFDATKWSFRKQYMRQNWFEFKELSTIVEEVTTKNVSIELQEVTALSNSKSDLKSVSNLDEFAIKYCPTYINELSEMQLNTMLSHKEIKTIHKDNTGDFFKQFSWRDGTVLVNNGGSHHLAAARYLASRLNKKIDLHGSFVFCQLSKQALEAFRSKYTIFLIEKNMYLYDALISFLKYKATAFIHLETQPNACIPGNLLFFENENTAVIDEFKANGFFDVGAYLAHAAR